MKATILFEHRDQESPDMLYRRTVVLGGNNHGDQEGATWLLLATLGSKNEDILLQLVNTWQSPLQTIRLSEAQMEVLYDALVTWQRERCQDPRHIGNGIFIKKETEKVQAA